MAMPNVFSSNAFEAVSLTLGINRFPNQYGRLNELGVFPFQGVATRSIAIEEYNGVLNLLQTQRPGTPGSVGMVGKRKIRNFEIPHIPHDDVVLPEEVQNVRQFGTDNALATQAELMGRKLKTMSDKHDITHEYHRMGALKGIILDADGSTLYNLYTEFGITQKVIAMALTTSTTEVLAKCLAIQRHIEDKLQGEVYKGIRVLCSEGFYDAFTTHGSVKEAFKYFTTNQQLSMDLRGGFTFGGITFEEYRGTSTDASGTVRPFIAADEAHAFPMGTQTTFRMYGAPADFNEAANTIGLPKYAKQEPRKFGRGWDIHTQSNPLAMCHRPELLVKLTKV